MDSYSISLQIYKKIPNPANVKTLRYAGTIPNHERTIFLFFSQAGGLRSYRAMGRTVIITFFVKSPQNKKNCVSLHYMIMRKKAIIKFSICNMQSYDF